MVERVTGQTDSRQMGGVYAATWSIIATTVVSLAITYIMEKRIAAMPLVSGIAISVDAIAGGVIRGRVRAHVQRQERGADPAPAALDDRAPCRGLRQAIDR